MMWSDKPDGLALVDARAAVTARGRGSDRLAWPVAAAVILAASAGSWLAILAFARYLLG